MSQHSTRLYSIIIGLALLLSLLHWSHQPPTAVAEGPIDLPAYRTLVQDVARASWSQHPASEISGPVTVLVQADIVPIALGGAAWSHAQRQAYMAQVAAAQEALAPKIEALGGTVVGNFDYVSTGIAVVIDVGRLADLRALDGVAGVIYVSNYALSQATSSTETSLDQLNELIGSAEVRRRGNDGSGVDIALIDTGIDYTHRKLGGSGNLADYYRAACGSSTIRPGQAGCDSGLTPPSDLFPNSKVRGGYDMLGDVWPNADPRCGLALYCSVRDPNPIDLVGHGTHVADIAAGLPLAGDGSDAGVAPGANLWAFKACSSNAGLCEGVALLRAIDAAIDLDGSDRDLCTPGLDAGCLTYDPADVINLSISIGYGQPEDALTLFANIAGYYGSLVVASAGDYGDKPYIVGSPATAEAALAVGESALPAAPEFVLTVGGRSLDALRQTWSVTPTTASTLELRYGDGSGANTTGCTALAAWSGVLLLDRSGCTSVVKAANAVAAGARLLLIVDSSRADAPPILSGLDTSLPVYSLTQSEGDRLRTALAVGVVSISLTPLSAAGSGEIVTISSSRGPRIADGAIKPDISAPGAIRSAQVGSGSGLSAFGGASGSAPVAAGSAALIIQELEKRGILEPTPGLADVPGRDYSLAPLVKSVLMNGAMGDLQTSAGIMAPITLQGAGRIDVLRAYTARTLVMDVTDTYALYKDNPNLPGCTVDPFVDMLNYVFFKTRPACAKYPFGDPLMRSWNKMAGSISFGYNATVDYQEIKRQILVVNYSLSPRSYSLSSSFRYADDAGRGAEISYSPASFTLGAVGTQVVDVTLKLNARTMRDWTLNGGALGDRGTVVCSSANPEVDCPSLTLFEIDGFLTVDGGPNNQIRVPWQVLPHKVANVSVSAVGADRLTLQNTAPYKAGTVSAFALVDISPNKCDTDSGICTDVNYIPGIDPGSASSPVDINYVGVRGYSKPGLNASLGLPAAPTGATTDELIEFAITVYDKPYRASPNYPAQFEVHVDNNGDGAADYVVFTADAAKSTDGKSAVFVQDVNPADGTTPTRPYFYTVASFNSQNWVLPVPAAAIGLRSDRPFSFWVKAYDNYFDRRMWDCSPGAVLTCGTISHKVQTGALSFAPAAPELTVPAAASANLLFSRNPSGVTLSPAQLGLLLLYRDAPVGQESYGVQLK